MVKNSKRNKWNQIAHTLITKTLAQDSFADMSLTLKDLLLTVN